MQQEFEFTIAFDDFDASLLPAEARTPGSEAFVAGIRQVVAREFGGHGGWARIVADANSRRLTVTWGAGDKGYDPLASAVGRLKRGDYATAIPALELLRHHHPDSVAVHYNLGMALSDQGNLATAIPVLRKAVALAPRDGDARVALGVALARQGRVDDAVAQLREAVAVSPTNPWAFRNLGGILLKQGKAAESEPHLRRAVELNPDDPAARSGLGKCLIELGRLDDADGHLVEAIRLDPHGLAGDAAKEGRSRIAQVNFRGRTPGGVRPDAVMYCLGAMERFGKMTPQRVQGVGFEIAVLGMQGIDPADSERLYTLKSLPGQFSGLQLLCVMYVAFRQVAPDRDTGFDVSREYALALSMHNPARSREDSDGGATPENTPHQ